MSDETMQIRISGYRSENVEVTEVRYDGPEPVWKFVVKLSDPGKNIFTFQRAMPAGNVVRVVGEFQSAVNRWHEALDRMEQLSGSDRGLREDLPPAGSPGGGMANSMREKTHEASYEYDPVTGDARPRSGLTPGGSCRD